MKPLIEKLDVHPGEVLLVQFPDSASTEEINKFIALLRGVLPDGVEAIWVKGDVQFSVVKNRFNDNEFSTKAMQTIRKAIAR